MWQTDVAFPFALKSLTRINGPIFIDSTAFFGYPTTGPARIEFVTPGFTSEPTLAAHGTAVTGTTNRFERKHMFYLQTLYDHEQFGIPPGTRTPTNSFGDCDAAITPARYVWWTDGGSNPDLRLAKPMCSHYHYQPIFFNALL